MFEQAQGWEYWLDKGLNYYQENKWDEAIECYNAAITLEPDCTSAYHNKAIALSNLEKFDEAIECYDEAIRLEPDDANLYLNKGLALSELERNTETIECYDEAIRLNPDYEDAYYNKGHTLYTLGNLVEAIECYDAAIGLNPDYFSAYFNKGCALYSLKRENEAIKCYDAAISLEPDCASTYFNKALALSNLFERIEAIECYDAAIKLEPNYIDAYNKKGLVLYDLGKKSEAIECYDAAIRINPDFSDAYYNKAKALYDLSRYDEVMECYDEIIENNPDEASAYFKKASFLCKEGRMDEAIECYDAGIELKPDDAEAYFDKGCILNDIGNLEEAIECYDAAIRIEPDIKIYSKKGDALNELGKKIEAIECYDLAIDWNPDYSDEEDNAFSDLKRNFLTIDRAQAYHNKGRVLYDLGRKSEVKEWYDIAISFDPNCDSFYCNKGLLFWDLGRNSEAIKFLNKAIKIENGDPLYYCIRAELLICFNREKEASEDLETAYTLLKEAENSSYLDIPNLLLNIERKVLKTDRIKILSKLNNLQKHAIEFKEGIQQLKNAVGDNAQLQKQIDDEYSALQTEKSQIVKTLVDFVDSKELDEETLKKILNADNETILLVNKMKEALNKFRMQVQVLSKQKVNRDDIESHALRINPDIENNSKFKSYYGALYDRLHSALSEAEVICGGNIAINTSNVKVFALSKAIELTPFVGNLLSNTFSGVAERINENNIKKYAIKLKSVMGSNPAERENVIKKASEIVTLNNRNKLDSIETNLEVEYWISKGFVAKCKDFFTVDVDYMLYQSKPQILGCIDALKIIYAIKNDQIKQDSNSDTLALQIALIPTSYNFSQGRTISANREQKACCEIFLIDEIKYRNPLLNKPELIKILCGITSLPIYKVIDYSNMLIELDYDIEEFDIEALCCLMISLA